MRPPFSVWRERPWNLSCSAPGSSCSFPLVQGDGFHCHISWPTPAQLSSRLSDCKQALSQQGSLTVRPDGNKNRSESVAPPRALNPPTCQPPPYQKQLFLGLKSTLKGPKGARVRKQGGQPGARGREGREELQERDSVLGCGSHMVEGP